MVRIIAGTLVDVGVNKTEPDKIKEILEKKDRLLAGKNLATNGTLFSKCKL